jgi:putative addiction module component (TIGR02574 family)
VARAAGNGCTLLRDPDCREAVGVFSFPEGNGDLGRAAGVGADGARLGPSTRRAGDLCFGTVQNVYDVRTPRRVRGGPRGTVAHRSASEHTACMAKPAIDIAALSPDERVTLIGELWDSLDALPPALSAEQSEELRRRIDRVQREGVSGVTIDELRARLLRS